MVIVAGCKAMLLDTTWASVLMYRRQPLSDCQVGPLQIPCAKRPETERVHKTICRYLGLKGISLLQGLCRYYNDTWTLWELYGSTDPVSVSTFRRRSSDPEGPVRVPLWN